MVNGVVWFLAIAAGLVLALRFWCKISRGRGLWVDDYWLIASLVRRPYLTQPLNGVLWCLLSGAIRLY